MSVVFVFLYFFVIINCCYAKLECLQQASDYQSEYVEPILKALIKKGYTIREKGYLLWKNETQYGGSPATLYGVWRFPNITKTPLIPNDDAPSAMLFHASDAILFTGCTPPKVRYYDFENFVYEKWNPNNSNKSFVNVFASTGAAIHLYTINVSHSSDAPLSSETFDTMTTMINTPDQQTYHDILNEYIKLNISDSINNNYIPNEYFHFIPYNFTANNYTVRTYKHPIDTYLEMATINEPLGNISDYNEYVKYKQPVYWITAENLVNKDSIKPRIPFLELYEPFNVTGSRNEYHLYEKDLNIYINDTIKYFENKYNMIFINKSSLYNCLTGDHYYGFNCYNYNTQCNADDSSEQYWSTHNGANAVRRHLEPQGAFKITNETYYILIGINHVNTNFTVYDNIIVYCEQNPIEGLFEPTEFITYRDYNNSCNNINIPTSVDQETLSKFYITQIARPWICNDINIPGICLNETVIAPHKNNVVNTFNLLNLETMTRPSQKQIIQEVFIQFKMTQ